MKQKIRGSEYADDASNSICSHLMPIAEWLEERGHAGLSTSKPVRSERGETARVFTESPLQLDEIESAFEIPDFIIVNGEHHQIACRRCWMAIVSTSQ